MAEDADHLEQHLVRFPTYDKGGVIYGCSERLWQYRPAALVEAFREEILLQESCLRLRTQYARMNVVLSRM
jgi:hypothetical protein